jgi:hypothetical protein
MSARDVQRQSGPQAAALADEILGWLRRVAPMNLDALPIMRGDLRDALRKVRETAHDEWLHTHDDSIRCARLQAKFELCDELATELGL